MEIRHLRYFVAVVETGTFRAAAARELVAQSALSKQVARLEGEVGARLLHRTTRNVALTDAGELLLPIARRILAEVEHARETLDALNGLRGGRLRVGAIQAGDAVDQLGLVGRFHHEHPGVELAVRTGASADLATAVRHGELDVAMVALPADTLPDGLTLHHVIDDPLVAVLGPGAEPVAVPVALEELVARGPFIHYVRGSGLRHAVDAALARAGATARPGFELTQIPDMVRLATMGLGVTVVPRGAVREGTPALALADPAAQHTIGLVHDAERLGPAARTFVDLVLG